MDKSKKSVSALLASGRGARFKNTSFNLLDEAEDLLRKNKPSIPTGYSDVNLLLADETPPSLNTSQIEKQGENPVGPIKKGSIQEEHDVAPYPLTSTGSLALSKQLVNNESTTGKQSDNSQITTSEQPVNNLVTTSKQSSLAGEEPIDSALSHFDQASTSGRKNSDKTTDEQPVNNKITTSKQLVNIQITTGKQISKPSGPTGKQPSNNLVSTGKQPVNELVNNPVNEPVNKPVNKPVNNPVPPIQLGVLQEQENLIGSDHKAFNLHSLSGHKKEILVFIYRSIPLNGDRISNPIYTESLAKALNTTKNSIKTILYRLEKQDKLIAIHDSKASKNGWRMFRMDETIYREIDRADASGQLFSTTDVPVNKPVNNPVNKLVNNPVNNSVNTPPSSSSSGFISEELTTEKFPKPDQSTLPEDWHEIDYSCLAPYRFTENHLLQIYQSGKVVPEVAQESIYELHHDLTVNKNTSLRNPRNVLLSLLKKGSPYTSPGYEPEYLKAERRCLEEQKRRQGELTKIQEEQAHLNQLPAKLEQDAQFQTWLTGTTEKQRRDIAPHAKTDGSEMQRGILRSYWETQVLNSDSLDNEDSVERVRRQIDISLGLTKSEV